MKLRLSSPTLKIFFFFHRISKESIVSKEKNQNVYTFQISFLPINEMEFVYSFSCSYSAFLNNKSIQLNNCTQR